jgi:hypothetical protein
MFGFRKKMEEMHKDPKKALDHADETVNKGFTGWVTKNFMGEYFHNEMNKGLDMARNSIEGNAAAMAGIPASADVLGIEDTGSSINDNPMVRLKLKITPQFGVPFEHTVETVVSRIAVPRVGDTLNIRYNPANPAQVAIV